MRIKAVSALVCAGIMVAGCATWSSSEVRLASTTAAEAYPTRSLAEIQLTEEDIIDRPYESLGDISVTVNKTTLFHPDPTPDLVDIELRKEAAKLGAEAVVLVRYGTVGVGLLSWGSLDGNGRAVRFVE